MCFDGIQMYWVIAVVKRLRHCFAHAGFGGSGLLAQEDMTDLFKNKFRNLASNGQTLWRLKRATKLLSQVLPIGAGGGVVVGGAGGDAVIGVGGLAVVGATDGGTMVGPVVCVGVGVWVGPCAGAWAWP